MRIRFFAAIVLLATLLLSIVPAHSQDEITVSGMITHGGAPIADVPVIVNVGGQVRETITRGDGAYSFSVSAADFVFIHVRPPHEMRLAARNWGVHEGVTGDIVKNFDLQSGYLLSGKLLLPDGSVYEHGGWVGLSPFNFELPEGEWMGDSIEPGTGTFAAIVPPGVYEVGGEVEPPYFISPTEIDLSGGDVLEVVFALSEQEVFDPGGGGTLRSAGFPKEPPRADLITVSEPDSDGYAQVTGAAGAVPAGARVFIANVSAHIYEIVDAGAEGTFSAQLYAPKGSALLVKYDVKGDAIREFEMEARDAAERGGTPGGDGLNELPGAMLQVGGALEPGQFVSVGMFGGNEGPMWAGWQLEGRIDGAKSREGVGWGVQRGSSRMQIRARLRVTMPGIPCTSPPDVDMQAFVDLQYLFDAQGDSHPWGLWFTSHLFTPTGLPIEHEAGHEAVGVGHVTFRPSACAGEYSFDAPFELSIDIPQELPDGIYLPTIFFPPPPQFLTTGDGIRKVVIWYGFESPAILPPLAVGNPAVPRIPWVMFGNVLSNGDRGITAREDEGTFELVPRVVTPPHQFVIPLVDARTNEPIAYRLEPGSPWISQTDRRQPCPPRIPLITPSGTLSVQIQKPDGITQTIGPSIIAQTHVQTPSTPGGAPIDHGTGHLGDLYGLFTEDDAFAHTFDQYGHHTITLSGEIHDAFGNTYPISGTYDVYVARILDLDPAQLPTTPYVQGDSFAPGLHVFPQVPAEVNVKVTHLPYSDPLRKAEFTTSGWANRFGIFQPPPGIGFQFREPGEFRVDLTASYQALDGTLWMGAMTWGGVVEGKNAQFEAHGRRGMDYHGQRIDDMPAWFELNNLPPEKIGIEMYYPYFSGDVHWGGPPPGDSIHSIITIKDTTPGGTFYNLLREHFPRARNGFRWPPDDPSMDGLEKRIAIGEAPLFITTSTGHDPAVYPDEIDLWAYWYGSSQRADVRVRELITEDNMGTAYWRFDDTYGYQIGEGAAGDLPGDLKWEFGGAVVRVPGQNIADYAIYSSLWVLIPDDDPIGARVTPPFQDATGASINGGPIMTLRGEDVDMLFLPKGVRPGDVLEVGDTVSFSGHVGPPLDSRVDVTITAPSGATYVQSWHANKIGWLYDPDFDFIANEEGVWTVDVLVTQDRPYVGNGVIPMSHNTGTVLGTQGTYTFYVVPRKSKRLTITAPASGFLVWEAGSVEPITITGTAPVGTAAVTYTVHDKGVVMDSGTVTLGADGTFSILYDARSLSKIFPFLSLTAREGWWEGLADEVAINMIATGGEVQANTVTLIGEEVFIGE